MYSFKANISQLWLKPLALIMVEHELLLLTLWEINKRISTSIAVFLSHLSPAINSHLKRGEKSSTENISPKVAI